MRRTSAKALCGMVPSMVPWVVVLFACALLPGRLGLAKAQERHDAEQCSVVSEGIARASAASIAVGPGSAGRFAAALDEFVSSPTALAEAKLAHRFAMRRRIGTLAWSSVVLASHIQSPEAVEFMRDVALAPPLATESGPRAAAGQADGPAWSDFQVRLAAVLGLANYMASGTPDARGAVMDVISNGETEICRMLAVELWVRDLLEEFRSLVEGRGIFAQFRALTSEERQAALAIRNLESLRAPEKPRRSSAPTSPLPRGRR